MPIQEDAIVISALECCVILLGIVAYLRYFSRRTVIVAQGLDFGFRILLAGLATTALFSTIDIFTRLAFPHFVNNNIAWYIHDLRFHPAFEYLLLAAGLLVALGIHILLSVTCRKTRVETPSVNNNPQHVRKLAPEPDNNNHQSFFFHSPGMLLSLNKDTTIKEINLYAAEKLDAARGNLIGSELEKYCSSEDITGFLEFLAACYENQIDDNTHEIKLNIKNTSVWFRICARCVLSPNKEPYLLLVFQDISDARVLEQKIAVHATRDSLTSLYNRHALESYLNKIFEEQSLFSKPAALIYFDLDQFKLVNGTCGLASGDKLLQQMVATIGQYCTNFDFFARISGDEFALVQTNTDLEKAMGLAESVRCAVEDITFCWDSHSFRQSASVGVALTSPRICTLTAIFGAADAACLKAKETGRNRVVLHKESRNASEDSRHNMLWISRIQQAFASDQMVLYFQPIVSLKNPDKNHPHYELLIRYVDSDGSHVKPEKFLTAAEKYGIAYQIDLWVLTTALDFFKKHPQHTRQLNCCSINLSANSLGNFQTRSAIRLLMEDLDFPTHKICFEITESCAIQNLQDAVEFIGELKNLGCQFALDDFGTGYSSLGYLKNLDVDYLKIDGAFIRDIAEDEIDHAMVTAIANISKAMKIKTIAEYVENEKILETLLPIEIDFAQGYGLAQPMELEHLLEYYQTAQHPTT